MTRSLDTLPRRSPLWAWTLALGLILCLLACAADDSSVDTGPLDPDPSEVYEDVAMRQGLMQMRAHKLKAASEAFAQAQTQGTSPAARATGQAGRAIMRLLLLGDEPDIRSLLTEVFAPERPTYDFERLVWQEQGILYWLARGVRWEDDGLGLQGVRSIVGPELPFLPGRLKSLEAFAAPLGMPLDVALPKLGRVMPLLAQIEADLRAATDEPAFAFFYLPGDLFFSPGLNAELRRSDLHLLRATLLATQALYHFALAYTYDTLQLDQLLPALDGPDDADWAAVLNGHLLRTLSGAQSLEQARTTLAKALAALRASIDSGLGETVSAQNPLLDWAALTRTDRAAFRGLAITLAEIESSLHGPVTLTQLPDPTFTFDLSPAFAPGVTMPPEQPWVIPSDVDPTFYDPVKNPWAKLQPQLALAQGQGGLEDYVESLDLERLVFDTLLNKVLERLDQSELAGVGF